MINRTKDVIWLAGEKLAFSFLLVVGLCIGLYWSLAPASASSSPSGRLLVVYDDQLSSDWEDWSWDTKVDLNNNAPVQSGKKSIAVDFQKPWSGFSLRIATPIEPKQYPTVTLWVHGGKGKDKLLRMFVQETDSGGEKGSYTVKAPAGVWTPITVTMSQLGNPKQVARLMLQDQTGEDQDVFYVDRIVLLGSASAPSAAKDSSQAAKSTPQAKSPTPTPKAGMPAKATPGAAAPGSGATLVVYDDQLSSDWEDWSWDTKVDLNNNAPVQSGKKSIAVDFQKPWAAFSLRIATPIEPKQYPTVTLWVHGGKGKDKLLRMFVQETDSGGEKGNYMVKAPAGMWTPITVTMSQLGNPKQVARLMLQDQTGEDQDVFYVDRIVFLSQAASSKTTSHGPMNTAVASVSGHSPMLLSLLQSNRHVNRS